MGQISLRKQQLLEQIVNQAVITDERVLEAFKKVPREKFVLPEFRSKSYLDIALPIQARQTISQPSLVLLMTQLLNLTGKEKVLEIGTGSGYQTALLSHLAKEVFTIERIPTLSKHAVKLLKKLGYQNIKSFISDGSYGLAEFAPFDRILVTAGAREIPSELINQLSPGGRMVIPVGQERYQVLKVIDKTKENIVETDTENVSFVPLIRGS